MNKKAEFIYINRTEGNCRRIALTAENYCDVRWLNVQQAIRAGTKELPYRQNKQLARKIKKYCGEQTIILGNERAVRELELPNRLFQMRKQELLHNVRGVFRYFQNRVGCESVVLVNRKKCAKGQDLRSRFLLVLESAEWSHNEIAEILWAVKDFYEDIYIVLGNTVIDQERLQDYFCEECGVVLHIITTDTAEKLSVDAVLFLLNHWENVCEKYRFRMGYVVSEWEMDMVRKRKALRNTTGKEKGIVGRELYAGFVYEYEKKQISYEKAITYSLKMKGRLQKENPISIVAIYGVE